MWQLLCVYCQLFSYTCFVRGIRSHRRAEKRIKASTGWCVSIILFLEWSQFVIMLPSKCVPASVYGLVYCRRYTWSSNGNPAKGDFVSIFVKYPGSGYEISLKFYRLARGQLLMQLESGSIAENKMFVIIVSARRTCFYLIGILLSTASFNRAFWCIRHSC